MAANASASGTPRTGQSIALKVSVVRHALVSADAVVDADAKEDRASDAEYDVEAAHIPSYTF
jgi:hypothetical protein